MIGGLVASTMVPSGAVEAKTEVTSVEAAVSGDGIQIGGSATFVDAPMLVAEDAVGDALPPGMGWDIDTATIARPVGSNSLVFSLKIGDALSAPISSAPGAVFLWPLSVDGQEEGYFLQAGRVGLVSTTPLFGLFRMVGSMGYELVQPLEGTMSGGVVSWSVPIASIEGSTQGGARISAGSSPGTQGVVTGLYGAGFGLLIHDQFSMQDDYTIPAATVGLGVAPVDTPDASVPITAEASVDAAQGTFAGSLATPPDPGQYKVVAEACYVRNVCGRSSTTVVVG